MLSSFAFPTSTLSGSGALERLPELLRSLQVRRPLVVTDAGLLGTPAWTLFTEVLGPAPDPFCTAPNPEAEDVLRGAEAFRAGGCDGVIAVGGGSAMDVAKILRVAALQPDWPELPAGEPLPLLAPCLALPTTAGTGSEVGRSSVIIFAQTKRVLFHPALLPTQVVLDPRLTAGLPPHLTAATGADALTHCIEAVTSPVYHPLCEAVGLEGARLAMTSLPRAVEQGSDLQARSQMQVAALMGGIAFQKDLGAVHSLSHPLSAHFGLHHGLANALCLPAVLRWNAGRLPGVYRRLAEATGSGATDADFIHAVETLLARIGLEGGLRSRDIPEGALARLAEAAFADSCHRTNPVPVTQADLEELYVRSMG